MYKKIQYTVTTLQADVWYSLLIAILAVLSILMLGYEFVPGADPALVALFQRLDLVVAFIFLSDFFLGLVFNTSVSRTTFFKQNWLNLISSIPITSEVTRALRILRILRAIRLIRAGMNFWFAKNRLAETIKNKQQ